MTDAASAIVTIGSNAYPVPKSGTVIRLAKPITVSEARQTKVQLCMYDRQPETGCYFTVGMPTSEYPTNTNQLDLIFIQSFPQITFHLDFAKSFIETLSKNCTPDELRKFLPTWQVMIQNKKDYLAGLN
jgi:hypothetical protein